MDPATGSRAVRETASARVFEAAPVALAVIGGDGRFVAVNASFAELFGVDAASLCSGAVADLFDRAEDAAEIPPTRGSGPPPSRVHRFGQGSRRPFWGRTSLRPLDAPAGRADDQPSWLLSVEDVTETVEGLRLLHDVDSRHRSLIAAAPVGIFLIDGEGRSTFVNDRWVELTGINTLDGVRDGWMEAVHPDDRAIVIDEWTAAVEGRQPFRVEYRLRRPDGDEIWVQSEATAIVGATGAAEGFLGTMVDITASRHVLDRLQQQTAHDLLTGLANRAGFMRRLEQAMPSRREGAIAALFCDLDGFKAVNDGLGHDAGDALLIAVAERINSAIRDHDTAARFGGDEFVVLLEHLDPGDAAGDAAAVADRIVAAIGQPVPVAGTVAHVSASVGIAVAVSGSGSTEDADTLLRWADLAMYQAKLAGKARWRLFDVDLRDRVDARRALEVELRAGVPSQLEVRFPPVCHLVTDAPVAYDAVAWWHHPRRGLVHPTGYVQAAEDAGLDVELERWVLGRAAQHAAQRQAAGQPDHPVWVAVSTRNLRRGDFAEFVADTVEQSGIEPRRLGVSVPQHALGRHAKQVAVSLQWLTMIGVQTGIHGFGVEPFSIPLLQELQVESILLHPELLEHLGHDDRALVNIAAIAGIARALGIAVTAAGVTEERQADLLQSVGCRAAGGPLFPRARAGDLAGAVDQLGRPGAPGSAG